jgi:hypothetical protein
VLLCILAGLTAYLVAAPGGPFGSAGGSGNGPCSHEASPKVIQVPASYLSGLRRSVLAALPRRIGRLYEEGTITSANAWSDDLPSPPTTSPGSLRPAGYEMRWWAPNGDDVVADVFVFANSAQARRFVGEAGNARCRALGWQMPASWPAGAYNLRWVNPERVVQADVFLARGERVFRVADVPPQQRGPGVPWRTLRRTFLTIDTLACLLPGADCSIERPATPA